MLKLVVEEVGCRFVFKLVLVYIGCCVIGCDV